MSNTQTCSDLCSPSINGPMSQSFYKHSVIPDKIVEKKLGRKHLKVLSAEREAACHTWDLKERASRKEMRAE